MLKLTVDRVHEQLRLRSTTPVEPSAETSKIFARSAPVERTNLAHICRGFLAAGRAAAGRARAIRTSRSRRLEEQRANACGQRGWNVAARVGMER
jgi:hypothetical protein